MQALKDPEMKNGIRVEKDKDGKIRMMAVQAKSDVCDDEEPFSKSNPKIGLRTAIERRPL